MEFSLIFATVVTGLGDMGMSLSIASIGSAIGTGIAGMAAIGAWKKMIISGQKAATALLIFCRCATFPGHLWNDFEKCHIRCQFEPGLLLLAIDDWITCRSSNGWISDISREGWGKSL